MTPPSAEWPDLAGHELLLLAGRIPDWVLAGARPAVELPALPFAFTQIGQDGEVRRDDVDEAVVAAAARY